MKRGFTLNQWINLCCTASAKLFGMFPKKGTIAVGSDADIVVFDPDVERRISAKTHHMNCDYSLFEGWRINGYPETVLSRGKVIIENNEYNGRPGEGKFLKRGACATARRRIDPRISRIFTNEDNVNSYS
jgi:dihydropyrimidinase